MNFHVIQLIQGVILNPIHYKLTVCITNSFPLFSDFKANECAKKPINLQRYCGIDQESVQQSARLYLYQSLIVLSEDERDSPPFLLHEISFFFIALQLTAIIVCIALFEPFSSLDFTLPYVFVFGPVFVVVRIFIRHLLPANRFIEYMANKCTMHTNNGAGTYTCTPSTATPFAIKAIFMRLANLLAINFPSHCGRLVNINNVSNDERHTPRVTNACRI